MVARIDSLLLYAFSPSLQSVLLSFDILLREGREEETLFYAEDGICICIVKALHASDISLNIFPVNSAF